MHPIINIEEHLKRFLGKLNEERKVIQGLSNISHLYQRFISTRPSERRITVPVTPLMSSTAVFKHVIGVPARGDTQGIPVFKLRVLDSLIEHLIKLGNRGFQPLGFDTVQKTGIDRLIEKLDRQAHTTESRPYARPSMFFRTGTVVNIFA